MAGRIITAPLRPVRPLLPYLLPFVVCLLSIPLLIVLSGTAGWFVWKSVPVGWEVDTYLQYGDAINPFAIAQLPQIYSDQPYDISLHLVVPATESNYALGNFMITLRISSAYNESIVTVRRSTALVPPRASYLRQTLWGYPPTLNVDVPLLSQFMAGTTNVQIRLEIGRADGWKSVGSGQARELTVLEATVKGIIRPTGIRYVWAVFPCRIQSYNAQTLFFQ
ncbi:hypothetical protein M422DRAFT_195758 [Sphaerobolus stellatus SS14]|uniref:Uncharacterized protein n=1 Tax=Sphaerobolus stellatus (strain SS14) TaxID=990650 RepID=A0A0C9UDQ8_SPHS4|nr:hypothetical protein M422DRAFT_195758 [Sphaerobolus stellatus SS14]